MRHSIGAVLLDEADPFKVLGRCCEPLLRPESSTREGYVPNVVYTGGGLRHTIGSSYLTRYQIPIATLQRSRLLHCWKRGSDPRTSDGQATLHVERAAYLRFGRSRPRGGRHRMKADHSAEFFIPQLQTRALETRTQG